jgi:hypothetical protein
MKTTVTIEIDTERLNGYTDAYVAQLWHIAQANPAPHGDRDASTLAAYVGTEIIRRWLKLAGAELHNHQPGADNWKALLGLGAKFIDGAWCIPKEGESNV